MTTKEKTILLLYFIAVIYAITSLAFMTIACYHMIGVCYIQISEHIFAEKIFESAFKEIIFSLVLYFLIYKIIRPKIEKLKSDKS